MLSYGTSSGALRSRFRSTSQKGAGRISEADAARHFAIARGSAMECAAVLDVIRALGLLEEPRYCQAMEVLARVVAMLTKLCR